MQTKLIQLEVKNDMDISRTVGVGILPESITYDDLVRVLGEPEHIMQNEWTKSVVEWCGTVNGLLFTIYDYNIDGDVNDNTEWRIGGSESEVADLVIAYIQSHL